MTSSTRCSSRRPALAVGLLAAAALAAAGCAHRSRPSGTSGLALEAGRRPRIVLLPVDNASGGLAPAKELRAAIEAALRPRFELVSGDVLEEFLARRRIRYTGGIDAEGARAAREELGADAVLVTTLELYRPVPPPAIGLTMRLVSTADEPVILWMDGSSRAGDESPGLLRLGVVDSVKVMEERVIAQLVGSLAAFADGKGARGPRCGGAWYAPKVRYRSALLDEANRPTLAVLPFLNLAGRRGAGDAMTLEFVRHLVATGRYRILEPGVVREFLLRARVMIPGGASLEATRLMLGALGVELVVSGDVLAFEDNVGPEGPTIRFTVTMLDGGSGEVVWRSTSYNRGDDGVFAFGLGRVRTSGELSCRMVGDVVRAVLRPGATTSTPLDEDPRRRSFSTLRKGPRDAEGEAPK